MVVEELHLGLPLASYAVGQEAWGRYPTPPAGIGMLPFTVQPRLQQFFFQAL